MKILQVNNEPPEDQSIPLKIYKKMLHESEREGGFKKT